MNKRTLALLAFAGLVVLGLAFALSELQELQGKVKDQGSRIVALEEARAA
jgi:hypothetical protein